jgi:hypothetical protein
MASTTAPLSQGLQRQTRHTIKEMRVSPLKGLCALSTKPWAEQSTKPPNSSLVREAKAIYYPRLTCLKKSYFSLNFSTLVFSFPLH